MKHLLFLTLLFASLFSQIALAYPDFIGYGYSSCLTCHTNGLGGGPINDYGRGLWAAEIASRALYNKSRSLDDLSEHSGFLGSTGNLPWWIRPHVKYRGLWLQRDPGSKRATQKYYPMQLDLGGTIYFDQDQKYSVTYTAGYVPNAATIQSGSPNRILARDYYLRVQMSEPLWLYLGKMEKVYGIRNIDHTSYNRSPQELTQNSQSHGLMAHWVQEKYEIAGNLFTGDQGSENIKGEQKGLSLWSEFQAGENRRIGASVLSSKNDLDRNLRMLGIHWRQGLTKGSALMAEYGYIQKVDKTLNSSTNGTYTFIESFIELEKGYNLLVNLERYNADGAASTPEQWKYGFGFVMFPINRTELRIQTQNSRQVSSEEASPDSWNIQGQLRVSL